MIVHPDNEPKPKTDKQRKYVRYHLEFEFIDGSKNTAEWEGLDEIYLTLANRPHTPTGLQYETEDGKKVFIPWHQIKRSMLTKKDIE